MPDARQVAAHLQADGALFFELDGQDLRIVDLWPPHESADALTLQVGFGVTGRVARTGRSVLLADDSPPNGLQRQLLRLAPHETVARMCVPLRGLDDRPVGVLAVHRSPRRPFGASDLDKAESLASLLGLRIHANQLWRAVSRHRSERDRLIKQAISAQEAERRRIAFDLHDGVTTALASMSFHLSAADLTVSELSRTEAPGSDRRASIDSARRELATARQLADLAYNQTRAAITGLHSLVLDDLGLVAAIESLVQLARREDGPTIDFLVDAEAAVDELPDHAAAALYRIAQEALHNAVKHAHAKHIVISLRRIGDSMVLRCTDDGVGLEPAERLTTRAEDADGAQHFGLSSVAERCAMMEASLRIESAPGRGTTLLVELPLT